MPKLVHSTKKVSSWADLTRKYHARDWIGWAFRGHTDGSWRLKPSLEREVTERLGYGARDMSRVEADLVRAFRRNYHRYANSLPEHQDTMEWWSIMQHYGAPTRLLDFSYSFWVAAHFAVDDLAPSRTKTCAIWAFDCKWWAEKACQVVPEIAVLLEKDQYAKDPRTVTQMLALEKAFVYPMNPFRMDERLAIQQGTFVVPGDLTQSFESNLRALDRGNEGHKHLLKFEIAASTEFLKDAFRELDSMNIGNTSLFPGVPGFSRDFRRRAALVLMKQIR